METALAAEAAKGTVTILMNGRPFHLQPGTITVSQLKQFTGVPQAHEVAQIIRGQPVPLSDTAVVTLKSGEQFISYPRDSASS